MKTSAWNTTVVPVGLCLALAGIVFHAAVSFGQAPGRYSGGSNSQRGGSTAGVMPRIPQNPFSGSVAEGKATAEALPLSFKDAIDRGLRTNLGILLQSENVTSARAERWRELSELLPNVNGSVSETVAQQDLAAFGFRFPGIPMVIGPYNYFDARASVSQSLFDLHAIHRVRGASANEKAAQHTYKDARDMVVLAVGNLYLLTLSAAARVETAQAQVDTGLAIYNKSADQQKAGVIPAIDALRAQVELQARQQQLIVARNNLAKQKLALARAIGLPAGQEFGLTDQAPYEPLTAMGLEESLKRAYASRSDYQAALQQVRAAEYFRKAASEERLPSVDLDADYGDLGVNPSQSHGTYQVTGTVRIPIFQGGKIHADELQAESNLKQSQAVLDDLRGRIDAEVRNALLDLNADAEQVEVARSSVDLANRTVEQARDRFAAGVTGSLEVVQAQEALAAANESYISSLYAHNVAKVALARAIGFAEEGVKQYLMRK